MWSSRPYTFDRVVRIFFTVVVACIAIYFIYVLRHVLLPFCAACLIAYLIEPAVRWNQRILKLKSHAWAVVLSTFEAVVILTLVCIFLVPIIEDEFSQLGVILNHYVENKHTALSQFTSGFHNFIHSHIDINKLIEDIERINITQAAEEVWTWLTSGLDKILGILGWLICVVYVIFILLDFDKYKNALETYIPKRYKPVASTVMHDISWTMKEYFRNQALISLIVGVCYGVGFSIVGIPMAVVIGLMNIVLFMIPYMVYLSLIPVTIMCMFKAMETGADFWVVWAECIAVYAFVETFSDLVLTPRIMGKALGLDPAIILLSLSIWGTLLGILGMLIALPVTTILMKWGRSWLTLWRDNIDAGPPPST